MKTGLPPGRWLLWLVLLAAAAGLALFGDKTPPGAARLAPAAAAPAAAVANPVRARPAVVAVEPLQALLPRAPQAAAALPPRADLFATPAWRARPAPPPIAKAASVPAAPPPPPRAPPAPYRFIGKQFDDAGWQVFLGREDTSFIVRQGDTVEGSWRVERIEPPALSLLHLPTGQAQSLDIGAAP